MNLIGSCKLKPNLPHCVQPHRLSYLSGFILLYLVLSACHSPGLLFDPPTPTVTPVIIQVSVQGVALPAQELTSTRQVIGLTLTPGYLLPTATPTFTPIPTPPIASNAMVELIPPPPPETPLMFSPTPGLPTVSTVAQPGDNIFNGPLTDRLQLLDPAAGYLLPAGQDQLEFKWRYQADDPKHLCLLEPGYGFEVRLWPHPASPYLPPAERSNVQPLGVVDAKQAQAAIAASCDPQTGIRRWRVTYLKSAPGIIMAGGQGQFFWDVAFVQLEPYYLVLGAVPPRDFFLPADGPTPTPGVTPTPTPAFPLTPLPRPVGQVVLLKPADGVVFPVSIGPVQFEWRWEGPTPGLCQLADGYGFELRLWSKQPDFPPLGVLDAVADQSRIHCDPASGVYSLIVPDLKQAPGVKATYKGELHWTGQFWWDVALVSIRPYLPPESASSPRGIELSLYPYTGPADWFGQKIRCSQFSTWPEAQAFFLAAGGRNQDPNNLDPDTNGIACEELIS